MTFDASNSVDVGFIVSFEWSFGDGTNGTGSVVSHTYGNIGTYQVRLNVTNDEGLSSLKTFAITVGTPVGGILLLSKVLLGTMLTALILILGILLTKRRTKRPPSNEDTVVKP